MVDAHIRLDLSAPLAVGIVLGFEVAVGVVVCLPDISETFLVTVFISQRGDLDGVVSK